MLARLRAVFGRPATSILAAVMILVVGAAAVWSIARLLAAVGWVEHTRRVIEQLDRVVAITANMESSVRGYLITGDPALLDPLPALADEIELRIRTLLEMTADNPSQGAKLEELEGAVVRRIAALEDLVDLGTAGASLEELRSVVLGRGRPEMERVRQLAEEMRAEELRLLDLRLERQQEATRLAVGVIGVGSLLAFWVALFASIALREDIRARARLLALEREARSRAQQGEASLRRSDARLRAQYRVTLALAESGPLDEVMGRILEALGEGFGWQLGEAWISRNEGERRLAHLKTWIGTGVQAPAFVRTSDTTTFLPGEGLPGRVLEAGEPAFVEDIREAPFFVRTEEALQAGFHSAAAFPLLAGGRVRGVIEVFSVEPKGPDPDLLQLMGTTGSQLGEFIERARVASERERLLEELRRNEADLRSLAAELEQRVKERTTELERANAELEAFAYSVSHDLRAPLRAIDGFGRFLLQDYGPALPPEAQRYLERIRAGTQKMGRLIDDLLGLSRVTRAKLAPQEVDLTAMARSILDELQGQDPGRRVDVRIGEDLRARGDPNLLRIALSNLLDNAWKYTRDNDEARIEVGARRENGRRVFFVKDNGVGFQMRYADKLFQPFRRLHAPEEFEGTGIGLATVKRIVERHGGTIWAEAEVGRGATFSFTLQEDA